MNIKKLTKNLETEHERMQFELINYCLTPCIQIKKESIKGKQWVLEDENGYKAGLYHLTEYQWGVDGLKHDSDIGEDFEYLRDNFGEDFCFDIDDEEEVKEAYSRLIGFEIGDLSPKDEWFQKTIIEAEENQPNKQYYQVHLANLIMERDKIDKKIEEVKNQLRLYLD